MPSKKSVVYWLLCVLWVGVALPVMAQNELLPLRPENVGQLQRWQTVAIETDVGARMAWSPSGQQVAVIEADGVRLYAYPRMQALMAFNQILQEASSQYRATALRFDHAEQYLAIGYENGRIQFLNLENGALITLVNGHRSRVSSLDFSPDNTRLLSSSGLVVEELPERFDFSVRLWDFTTLQSNGAMQMLWQVDSPDDAPFRQAIFTENGLAVAISAEHLYSLSSVGVMQTTASSSPLFSLEALQEASRAPLALWAEAGNIQVYDGASGVSTSLVNAPFGQVEQLIQAPYRAEDGVWFAALIRAENGEAFLTFMGSDGVVKAQFTMIGVVEVAFHPDAQTVAILREDALEVWGVTAP